jgi:putative FmdB family regulatory protein
MPIYEFKCKKCGHTFNLMESVTEHDKHREICPQCASVKIQSIISAVNVKTAKKS